MNTQINPVINRGARILPLPFTVALEVTTSDWMSHTETLRRPTDRQRILGLARIDRYGVDRVGPHLPPTCYPIVAVLRELDEYDLMPLSA